MAMPVLFLNLTLYLIRLPDAWFCSIHRDDASFRTTRRGLFQTEQDCPEDQTEKLQPNHQVCFNSPQKSIIPPSTVMPTSPFSALAAFPDHHARDAEDLDENTPPKKIRRWTQADIRDMHDDSNDGATHSNWRGEGPSWYTPVRRQHQPQQSQQSQPKNSENIERYRKIASAEDFARMPSFGMWLANSEEQSTEDQKAVGIKSNIQIDDLVTMFDDTRSNDFPYRSYPQSPIEKLFANSSEAS